MTHEEFPVLPEQLSEWKITEKLGSGTFGRVYLAEPAEDDADFEDEDFFESEARAIKILQVPMNEEELAYCKEKNKSHEQQVAWMKGLVDQILEKVHLQQGLQDNDHIVKIYDCFVDEDPENLRWTIYISMELLEPLKEYMRRHLFGEKEYLKLGIDLCDALQAMEEQQIIHRDIKPSNILVDENGNFKLADFGTSRKLSLESTMSIQGTRPFSAPEVVHQERPGASIDQYSLGISLYYLLNKGCFPFVDPGQEEFSQDDLDKAIQKRLMGERFPGPVDASEVLGRIICKACAWNPKERFKNAGHLRQTLEQYRDGRTITTKLPAYKPGNNKKERKVKRIVTTVALMLFCSVAGYAAITYVRDREFIRMSQDEEAIKKRAVQVDDLLVAYEDGVLPVECSPEDPRRKYMEELSGNSNTDFDNRDFYVIYEDETFSIGEIVEYSVKIRERTDHSGVESTYEEVAFFKEGEQWVAGAMDEAPEYAIQTYAKTYYPAGLLDAMAAKRDFEIFPCINNRGVYRGIIQTEAMAAWKNEDASVDILYAVRNGWDYDDIEMSYLLNLAGDQGDIVAVKGHCLLQGKAGLCRLYLAHFDSGIVNDVAWENVHQTSLVYDNQTNWMD